MEIGEIIGYTEKRDYTSKKTGEVYPCLNVAVSFKRNNFHGVEALTCWLRVMPDSDVYSYDWVALGVSVFVEYDRYGHVIALRPVESLK